jgi:hypothetical protein
MNLRLISFLLAGVRISAHLRHSHQEESKGEKLEVFRRRTEASLLPVKSNHSTIDWRRMTSRFVWEITISHH